MPAKLIETLGKYRSLWEGNPGDPVVYQRHSVSLRRDLARHRDHLKTQAEGGPAVTTARSAAAPVKPGTAASSIVRPSAPEEVIRKQHERTAGTHLRPDPAAMKKQIGCRRSREAAKATVADRALVVLEQIDGQVAKPRPDRQQLNKLFDDLKSLLGQLEEPKDRGPSTNARSDHRPGD